MLPASLRRCREYEVGAFFRHSVGLNVALTRVTPRPVLVGFVGLLQVTTMLEGNQWVACSRFLVAMAMLELCSS
jgi:hypothetical protein